MGDVLVDLLPLLIGAAVLPAWIIIVLFLLRGERGIWKATAFLGGAMGVRLAQGVIFGLLIETAVEEYGEESANVIASTLLLIVGLLLLLAAVKKWRREDDPDAPPPGWKEFLRQATPVKALGTGVLLMLIAAKQWVFTLSAIAVIEQGALSRGQNVLAYVIFTLAAQSLMLLPVAISAVAPARAEAWLGAVEQWLERHERAITIGASLIFGVWFFWKGVTGLLGYGM
jgi:hypothetical protein